METLEDTRNGLFRAIFFLSAFIFLSIATIFTPASQISLAAEVCSVVITVGFLVYSGGYVLGLKKRLSQESAAIILGAFGFELIGFLAFVFFIPQVSVGIFTSFFSGYSYIATYIIYLLPLLFLTFIGMYLLREGYRKLGVALFVIALLLLIFYCFSGLVFHLYRVDDETFLLFLSAKSLLAGANPYAASFSQQLFYNITAGYANQPSITTSSQIIGSANYPALYLLSFVPFYLLTQPTQLNLINIDLAAQELVFIFIALLGTVFVIDKKALKKPSYMLLLFVIIAFAYFSSFTTYLMFGLLLLAYAKLESRYSWILLGLCASLQEQLWIPVLLLLIYSFRNSGLKKGVYKLAGTIGIFVLINGYFIAAGPGAFFHNLLSPVNGSLFPNVAAYFGYLLTDIYPILLSSYSLIFALSIIGIGILFLYLNEKRLVGLLSMVPFLLNSHAAAVYYTFFTGFMIVTLFISEPNKKKGKEYFKIDRKIIATLLILVIALGIAVIYTSHLTYQKNFDLYSDNMSMYFNNVSNETIYATTLHYFNLSNNTVYVLGLTLAQYDGGYEGLLNSSVIENSQNCTGNYTCQINKNVLVLPKNATAYKIKMSFGEGAYSKPIYGARLVVYNQNYFYVSGSIFNQSIATLK